MGEAAAPSDALRVVGRAEEQERIDAFKADLSDGPRALAISGEPGIGKTTLWRHGIDHCRAAGFEVLVTRPTEEEMPLALVGLIDLFEPVGLEAAMLRATDDPFVRGRTVLEQLRRLAAGGPVVVAIDDVQWLDAASARALRHALRRIETEPVGLLTTVRPVGAAQDPLAAAAALPAGRTETLELGPLSVGALRRILVGTVDSISRTNLRRIHEASGGNPLYATELARAVANQKDPAGPWTGLPLPSSLQAAIDERLETVPRELTPVLETVAALGPTSVRELRQTLPEAPVVELLELAERHALLLVEEDLTVHFFHPLVGSAVYGRMRPLARRSLHARLAERTSDPDRRARHLALSTDEPQADIAALLEAAAGRAAERGSSDLAAEFARHSVRLTPPEDGESGRRRALSEVVHLAAAGDSGQALARADELIATLPPGPGRAEALAQRVYLDLESGEAVLLDALAEAHDDELLRAQLLDLLSWVRGSFRGDLRNGIECAREAATIAERLGDRRLEMLAGSSLAVMEALSGKPNPDRMAHTVALAEETVGPPLGRRPRVMLARQLLWDGDLVGARGAFERMRDEFARSGTEFQRPYRLCDLALLECAGGDLAAGLEYARQGVEAAGDAKDRDAQAWLLYPLALAEACLGSKADARATAALLLEVSARRGERPGIVRGHSVLGLLALSEGNASSAVDELLVATRLLEEMGIAHAGAFPALADGVEALACAGETEAALARFERLERQAASTGSPWVLAAVERCRGYVLLAGDGADAAAPAFEAAAVSFERLGYELDAARAAFGRGRALLRGGRRTLAADALAGARSRFAAMSAALWESRAVEELERAAPGRAEGALTTAERRVAALVAQGMKNREIGQTLFMSVATVEAHLTRIYRKLDLRSRGELARLVGEGSVNVGEE